MNPLVWLAVGGLIGWLASLAMRTDARQDLALNVVVGSVAALASGRFVSPLVGVGAIHPDALSIPALAVSLVGAVVLLAIVNLARRGRVR